MSRESEQAIAALGDAIRSILEPPSSMNPSHANQARLQMLAERLLALNEADCASECATASLVTRAAAAIVAGFVRENDRLRADITELARRADSSRHDIEDAHRRITQIADPMGKGLGPHRRTR